LAASTTYTVTLGTNTALFDKWGNTVSTVLSSVTPSVSAWTFTSSAAPVTTYTVTPSAGANGSISPSTPQTVTAGNSITFTFTPNSGYEVDAVTVGGSAVTPSGTNSHTFTPTANTTINVTFKQTVVSPTTYTIRPIVKGGNGTITPSTNQTVNAGDSRAFTFDANTNYWVDSVWISGVYTTAGVTGIGTSSGSYTFTNVQKDDSIIVSFRGRDRSVTFQGTNYSLTSITGTYGGTYPNYTARYGVDIVFRPEAAAGTGGNPGYEVDSVRYNNGGAWILLTGTNGNYTIPGTSITGDLEVRVFTTQLQPGVVNLHFVNTLGYVANIVSGIGGSIAVGNTTVTQNTNAVLTITPLTDYIITGVTYKVGVSGTEVPISGTGAGNTTYTIPASAITGTDDIYLTVNVANTAAPQITSVTTDQSRAINYINGGGLNGTTTYSFRVVLSKGVTPTPPNANFTVSNADVISVTRSQDSIYDVSFRPTTTAGRSQQGTDLTLSSSAYNFASGAVNQKYNIRRSFDSTYATYVPSRGQTSVPLGATTTITITFPGDSVSITGGGSNLIATIAPGVPSGANTSITLNRTWNAGSNYTSFSGSTTAQLAINAPYTLTVPIPTSGTGSLTDRWGNTYVPYQQPWTFTTDGIVSLSMATFSLARNKGSELGLTWNTLAATGIVVRLQDSPFALNPTVPPQSEWQTVVPGQGPQGPNKTYVLYNVTGSQSNKDVVWGGLNNLTWYWATAWAYDGSMTSTDFVKDSMDTPRKKEVLEESQFATFSISEITPHPIEDKAEFTVFVGQTGYMYVSIHDITGAKLMDVVDNRLVFAGTEELIKLEGFANIASGVYNLIIHIDDDKVVRTIVIRK